MLPAFSPRPVPRLPDSRQSAPSLLPGFSMVATLRRSKLERRYSGRRTRRLDVFQVVEGCVRLCRVLPDGRRAITGFAFPGGVLGISLHDRHAYTAEAVTAVRVRRMARVAFHAAVDGSAELRPQLLALIFDEMSAAQDQMVTLGCKNADERVASFLVTTARRTGADLGFPVEVELPMSRLDIAHFLGLTIETVSRTFSKLKRDGLISLQGHRTVRLLRMRRLSSSRAIWTGMKMPRTAASTAARGQRKGGTHGKPPDRANPTSFSVVVVSDC